MDEREERRKVIRAGEAYREALADAGLVEQATAEARMRSFGNHVRIMGKLMPPVAFLKARPEEG